MRRFLPLAVVGLFMAACADEPAPSPLAPQSADAPPTALPGARGQEVDFVPGQVLVRFSPGANRAAVAAGAGATVQRRLAVGAHVLSVPVGAELRVARALSNNPNVEYAEPDILYTFGDPALMPVNDAFIGYKWDLDNDGTIYSSTGAVLATTGGADNDMDWREAVESLGSLSGSARIGIMDTGIRNDHEEFTGRIAAQYDFYDNDANAEDDNGHGTHVAGIAAADANNGVGVAGVAYSGNVDFAIAKVCGQSRFGYGCPSSAIADGIVWSVDNGAHVLNLSLGGGSGSTTTRSALQYARSNNVLPFCASGNDNGPVSYPGAWPECVAVGSTDWNDTRASYSNFGPEVELSAPGGDFENSNGYSYILSAYNGSSSSYSFLAGTSMASPQAAGLGALLHVLGVSDDDQKLSIMKSSADDLGPGGTDDQFGAGRINVAAAAAAAVGGGGDPVNQAPTASFTYSCTELACSFDGSGSSDSDGSISSYAWDFGDGATGSGATASHTYAADGTYTVTLTVTDNDGATGVSSQNVSVASQPAPNEAPTASFTYSCTELACSFDGSGSSDSDGSISSYAWDFGDGTTATGSTPSHAYDAADTYTVTLTVTDDDGATDSSSQSVTVTEPDPPATGITLSANGYKVRGRHNIDLNWSGATSTNVDIRRDGRLIATTANDGAYTDSTNNRGGGSYTYQVCEAGTSTCSDTVTVNY